MIVAIMQPYFFPYIGYFQLMKAVDCFVFYDDAQFMKGGWVNRNRILLKAEPAWWTFPMIRAGYQLLINQRSYSWSIRQVDSLMGKIDGAYRKAPQFKRVSPMLATFLQMDAHDVARFNQNHLEEIARAIGIECEFRIASAIDKNTTLVGQDRILDICRRLGATHFVNPIGGLELYDPSAFKEAGIELSFIKSEPTMYCQFDHAHIPFLSIVDVLMFNTIEQTGVLLDHYETVKPFQGQIA